MIGTDFIAFINSKIILIILICGKNLVLVQKSLILHKKNGNFRIPIFRIIFGFKPNRNSSNFRWIDPRLHGQRTSECVALDFDRRIYNSDNFVFCGAICFDFLRNYD